MTVRAFVPCSISTCGSSKIEACDQGICHQGVALHCCQHYDNFHHPSVQTRSSLSSQAPSGIDHHTGGGRRGVKLEGLLHLGSSHHGGNRT